MNNEPSTGGIETSVMSRLKLRVLLVIWVAGCASQTGAAINTASHVDPEAARHSSPSATTQVAAPTIGVRVRAHSDEELARRFVAAIERNDQRDMNLLFVNQDWQLWVCPRDPQSSVVVPEVAAGGDQDLANALPAGRIIWEAVGPCTIERVVTAEPPAPAHSAYATGRVCESRYQETRDVVAILRCRADRLMGIDLNDVAVVDGVWAVRDKVAWRVCRPASPLPTCARICERDRDSDPDLCQRLGALLDGRLRRAITQ